MANGHGGARKGAGRKPKAQLYARQIRRAEKRIADELPDLIDRLSELAAGVRVVKQAEDGEEKVYRKPPDLRALRYLIDRIMGRPDVEPAAPPEAPDPRSDDFVLDLGGGPDAQDPD
jgi:hypothetical protein